MDDDLLPRLAPWELAAWLLGLAALQLSTLAAFWAADTGVLRVVDAIAAVAGLLLAPLVLRRPGPAGIVLGLLAAASPAATPVATAAAFTVAQMRPARTATVVSAAGVLAHLVLGLWRPTDQLAYGWWALLVVIAYATLLGWGRYLRTRRSLLASLRAEVRRAEGEKEQHARRAREDERRRIAREMHDVLAHRLSLVATYAGALEYRPDASREDVARAAGVVREGLERSLEELGDILAVLRDPDAASDEPAPRAPQPTLAEVPRLVEEARAAGTVIDLRVTGALEGGPSVAGRTAYRVVQEALTNARKHAPGRPVEIDLEVAPSELRVAVRTPMTATAQASAPGSRRGLVGLAERVELAGGRFGAGPEGAEFVLRASVPWPG